jgi:hypothetical protein
MDRYVGIVLTKQEYVSSLSLSLSHTHTHTWLAWYLWIPQTLCLWLDPELDISSIKQTLVEHRAKSCYGSTTPTLMWAARDLFFIWNGKPLDDAALLSDYMVGARSNSTTTIQVSYRNRGGCFMVSFSILCIICASLIGSFCTCGLSLLVVPVLLPLLFVLPLFCL